MPLRNRCFDDVSREVIRSTYDGFPRRIEQNDASTTGVRTLFVSPLLCQAYNGEVQVVFRIDMETAKPIHGVSPDEPQPKKALEIALSILKDRPNDASGHFHAGRSYARMQLPKSAKRELQAALDAGGLPPLYELTARQYVETGSENAFIPKPVAY